MSFELKTEEVVSCFFHIPQVYGNARRPGFGFSIVVSLSQQHC